MNHLHMVTFTQEEKKEIAGDDAVDENQCENIHHELFHQQIITEISSHCSKDNCLYVHNQHVGHI